MHLSHTFTISFYFFILFTIFLSYFSSFIMHVSVIFYSHRAKTRFLFENCFTVSIINTVSKLSVFNIRNEFDYCNHTLPCVNYTFTIIFLKQVINLCIQLGTLVIKRKLVNLYVTVFPILCNYFEIQIILNG